MGFHMPELIIVLAAALLIFGPKKLPEMGSAIGKSVRAFRKGVSEISNPQDDEVSDPDNEDLPEPSEQDALPPGRKAPSGQKSASSTSEELHAEKQAD